MRFLTVFVFALAACLGCSGPGADGETSPSDAQSAGPTDGIVGRGEGKDQWWQALPRANWSSFERVLPETEWFEVYRLEPDLFAIYEPGQFEEVISFLIIGKEFALLFDTGLGIGDIEAVVRQLTDLDLIVLNSHSHYDHVGGNHQFVTIAGLDDPYARRRALGLPHDEVKEFVSGPWIWKPLPMRFDRENYAIRSWAVSAIVEDGDTIDLGERELEVLHVPGHSPDSLALLDREGRRLFIGDTFYLAPLYANLEGSDFENYRASAARLATLASQVDMLMTGHNVPMTSSRYLIEMRDAFDAISSGAAQFVETDGAREYSFGDFSIIAPVPEPETEEARGITD